jgi:hypothetical protein
LGFLERLHSNWLWKHFGERRYRARRRRSGRSVPKDFRAHRKESIAQVTRHPLTIVLVAIYGLFGPRNFGFPRT